MQGLLQIRGPEFGPCAICSQPGKLTDDHVPPKGASRLKQTEMMHLIAGIAAEPPRKGNRTTQDGVKFRSICAKCNNDRLGKSTDPDLISLCNEVHRLVTIPLSLPPHIFVPVRPQRVLRSVVGHILAYGIERTPEGPFEESIAAYFLDTGAEMPSQLDCFVWIYPYNDQLIVRDALLKDLHKPQDDFVTFKMLKFYPLAFMLTWERPPSYDFRFTNLCSHRGSAYDDAVDLRIDLRSPPPRRWPEAPVSPEFFTIYGEGAMYAIERRRS